MGLFFRVNLNKTRLDWQKGGHSLVWTERTTVSELQEGIQAWLDIAQNMRSHVIAPDFSNNEVPIYFKGVVWAKMVKIIKFMFFAQKVSSGMGASHPKFLGG